MEFLKKNMYII